MNQPPRLSAGSGLLQSRPRADHPGTKRSHSLGPAAVAVLLALLCLLLAGCNLNPDVAKRKYVENGNKYFARGKYREASILYRSAINKDRRYGEAYYRLGLAELRRQQVTSAVRALRRAVELQPDNEDAKVQLANIFLISRTKSPNKAEEIGEEIRQLVDKILKRNPDSFHAYRILGQLALLERNYQEAQAHFQKAETLKPGDPNVGAGYCQVLNALGRFEECERRAWDLIQKEPKFEPIYDLLYQYYMARQRFDDAARVLEEKLTNNFNNAANILSLARHYWITGKPELTARTFDRVFASRHLYPHGRRMAAEFYLKAGDPQLALNHLRAGVRESTGDERAACERRIVEVLADQGDIQEAQRALQTLLKARPSDPDLVALQASLTLASPTPETLSREIQRLEQYVRKSPRNPALRHQLGRALWEQGQPELAKQHFLEAARLSEQFAAPRLALAQIFLNARDSASAMKYAEEALNLAPMEPRAHWLYVEALLAAGRTAQALSQAQSATARFATDQEAWLRLGRTALRAGNLESAELAFRGCFERFHSTACLAGHAEALTSRGRPEQGIKLISAQLQQRPSDPELRLALADLYSAVQRPREAKALYEELLTANQRSLALQLRSGKALLDLGDPQGALKHFQAAVDLDPNSPNALHFLTVTLTALGRKTEALAVCEKLLKLQPSDPIVLNNAAYLLAETGGDLERALTYAQRATRAVPNAPEFSDTLAWVYLKKKLAANSAEIYGQLVQSQPKSQTFRYRHALALQMKGDKERAASEARAALQLNPTSAQAKEIQALLANLR